MITPQIIEQYTEGDCWVLAIELAKATGWYIAITNNYHHVLVCSHDYKLVLDVTGLKTTGELKAEWGSGIGNYIYENLQDGIDVILSDQDWHAYNGKPDWKQAEELAKHLADKYLSKPLL